VARQGLKLMSLYCLTQLLPTKLPGSAYEVKLPFSVKFEIRSTEKDEANHYSNLNHKKVLGMQIIIYTSKQTIAQ